MRRTLLLVLLLILTLPSCDDRSRPEGIVERWLLALNQGAAGRAGRYADPPTSRLILPGYAKADPGRLDVVEVGMAERKDCSWDVPFRVIRLDGQTIRGFAIIRSCPTALIVPVSSVDLRPVPEGVFPSEGGPSVETERPGLWAIAVAIGLALLVVAEVLMRLVRRGAAVISSPDPGVGSERGGDRT